MYFTILVQVFMNHILAESTYISRLIIHIEWIEHKIIVLKSANKKRIIQHQNILIYSWFPASSIFFIKQKFFRYQFLWSRNNRWVIPSQIIQKNWFGWSLVYHFFTLVWLDKMLNFSPIQFVLLDLWSIKDNPCRPVPGGQKLHFFLAVFHKSYNILKTLCHMSLKIWSLPNFRVLDQNLMAKEMSLYGNYAVLMF